MEVQSQERKNYRYADSEAPALLYLSLTLSVSEHHGIKEKKERHTTSSREAEFFSSFRLNFVYVFLSKEELNGILNRAFHIPRANGNRLLTALFHSGPHWNLRE